MTLAITMQANDFVWGANDSLTVLGSASVTADSFNNSGILLLLIMALILQQQILLIAELLVLILL